jgi:plastocyanin
MTSANRIAGLAIVMMLATLGCGSGAAAGGPAPSAPRDGAVIVASNMSFDRTELSVPADRPFELLFENRDGAPHNVTVLPAVGDEPIYIGEVFTGTGSRLYDMPAIAPGTYRFRCDVHPDMAGTMAAAPSAAGSAGIGIAAGANTVLEPQPAPAPPPR